MVRPCVARGFVELAVSGLASMYPAFDLEPDGLLAIMGNSAPASFLPDRPQRAIWVTRVRMRREDRTSISSHLSQTSAGDRYRRTTSLHVRYSSRRLRQVGR